MDIRSIREQAFKVIQNNPMLYKQWHEVRSQEERDDMIMEQVYHIGWDDALAGRGLGAV
jgi:hypothetical protein